MSADPSSLVEPDAAFVEGQAQRVRVALAAVEELFSQPLQTALERSFNELDRHLRQLTEHMEESEERRQWLLLQQLLQRTRGGAAAHLLRHFADALHGMGEPSQARAAASVTVLDELGAWAPLARQARSVESSSREALCLLGVRFGAMAGVPALAPGALPIGPRQFCRFLRRSCEQVELDAELIHGLCPIFGRAWMAQLPRLYHEANALLARAGVLPNLPQAMASHPVPAEGTRAPASIAEPSPGPAQTASPRIPTAPAPIQSSSPSPGAGAPAIAARVQPQPAVAAPASPAPIAAERSVAARIVAEPVLPPLFLQNGAPDLNGFSRPLTGWPRLVWKGNPAAARDPAHEADTRLHDWYLGACKTLAARRAQHLAAQTATDASARIAQEKEIQAALGVLQAQPLAQVSSGGQRVFPAAAHVKQDLLVQLQLVASDGQPLRLRSTDEDVFELVDLAIASLLRNLPEYSPARELAARLQIAILRVALRDKEFFIERAHPARCFLGAVVEYAGCWLEGDGGDAETVAQLAAMVERAVARFSGDVAVFETMCAEFAAWRAAAERKAQIAERRHVEATAGRERLDAARNEAKAAIAQHLARGTPTPLVRVLLEDAWTQVLALALLREGRGGPLGASCLAAADRLVTAFGSARDTAGARIELAEEAFLRQTLTIGLGKVGYHTGDIQLILERLFSDDPNSHADGDLVQLLHPLRAAAASTASDIGATPGAEAAAAPADAREASLRAMIRALSAGTWLEFVTDASGRTARRKLARLNPANGRTLLVNLRGAKIAEHSVETLARAIVRGHARVLAADDLALA